MGFMTGIDFDFTFHVKEFSTRQSYINALFGELRDGQQFYKIDLMLDVYWITSLGAIYIQYTGVLATKTVPL